MGPTIHYELRWTPPNALAKTDRDIDQLVYQLYALTPEEIALVEGLPASGAGAGTSASEIK